VSSESRSEIRGRLYKERYTAIRNESDGLTG
jgi:hypothetical protein